MNGVITIKRLVDEGYYTWTGERDSHGREFLQRTEKGDCAAAHWSPEFLKALNALFRASAENHGITIATRANA